MKVVVHSFAEENLHNNDARYTEIIGLHAQ